MIFEVIYSEHDYRWSVREIPYSPYILNAPFKNESDDWVVTIDLGATAKDFLDNIKLDALLTGIKMIEKQRSSAKGQDETL